MSQRVRIAIDGPVASGKSTLGRGLARALGYPFLDTGTMYRGVTALALKRGVDPANEEAITQLAQVVSFSFPELSQAEAVNPPLLADGIDITATLRSSAVDRHVSAVSSYSGVRAAMVLQQQAIAESCSVVMVGRDIGTVVLPDAEVKIFLTASVEERAFRRFEERRAVGEALAYHTTLLELKRRDRLDSERTISPLRAASDALPVDTTGLSSEQSLERVLTLVRQRLVELGAL